MGDERYDLRAYVDAIPWYEEYVKQVPDDQGVIHDLGYCYFQAERFDDALKCFEQVDHGRNIALTLVRLGRYEEAVVYYEPVLSHNPQRYPVRFNYVSVLWYLRRFDEAMSIYKAAPRLPPMTYMGLGTIYRAHASEDFQKRNKGPDLKPPTVGNLEPHRPLRSEVRNQE